MIANFGRLSQSTHNQKKLIKIANIGLMLLFIAFQICINDSGDGY